MATITLDNCTFTSKLGDELASVTMEIKSPAIIGICAADQGPMAALMQLLEKRGKVEDGTVAINGDDLSGMRSREVHQLVATPDQTTFRGRTVKKAVGRALHRDKNTLSLDSVMTILHQLGINDNDRLKSLAKDKRTELGIVTLIAARKPVVVLNYAFDLLTEQEQGLVMGLLRDFVKKTDSLVLMASDDVSTMLKCVDVIYYFEEGHLTSARNLTGHESMDREVTVTGTGFPTEMAVRLGARMLEEAPTETRFLFDGNIQALLPLLEQDTITDVRIEDATVEDEIAAY